MKKGFDRFAFTALAFAAVGVAHAQSSVTLSGMMDGGVTYVSGQGHPGARFDDGIGFPNLLTLSGREDLGNGVSTIFRLTDQYTLSTGSTIPGQGIFSREAVVGLNSGVYGSLTLGKQYDFMVDSLFSGMNDGASMFTSGLYDFRAGPFTKLNLPNNPTGALDWDRMAGDMAISDSIKYTSPSYAGFQGGALYAFSNASGATGPTGNANSFGLTYTQGGFGAAAAITNQKSMIGPTWTNVRNWGVGAHYSLGDWTTTALLTTVRNSFNGAGVWGAQVSESWRVSPAVTLSGAWLYMKGNEAVDNNHANQLSLGATYAMSKRTMLYVTWVWQRANSGAQAQINGLTGPDGASSTATQALTRVGLKMMF